jgi:DNA mismatch endonuclease (patch repair protein)
MADNLTKEQRSKTMSRIRSKWTAQEKKIHDYLKGNKIKHQMHPNIKGSPDVILKDTKTAVFLHGCFWHKCPKCYIKPKTNKMYWIPKIENNVKRDRKNNKILKQDGFKVIRIWEHEIKKDFKKILNKLLKYGKN